MSRSPDAAELVEFSVRKYRRGHRRYERKHPEIFNEIEQARLREEVAHAAAEIRTSAAPVRVLDIGCGSGNLTRHLLDLGLEVTAADVSPHFLRLVERRFGTSARLRTLLLNGRDLSGLDARSMDMVCAYSVLHHIPDYLAIVDEACRVLRPGGVVYLDHEANDNFYDKSSCFWDLMRAWEAHRINQPGWWNPERRRWQRYLVPAKYYARIRQKFDPAYPWNVEGDIHVWESDRIEWDRVEERLRAGGCEVIRSVDYLNYNSDYPDDVWDRYAQGCSNMRLVVGRRTGDGQTAGADASSGPEVSDRREK
ncbi:MAG: class I SAM-dependent methyltransferase [Solirubrobacterales bacterium]